MRPNKPALIFLAAITLMGLLWGGDKFITRAKTSQVYVADCAGITYKPIVITKSCSNTQPRLSGIEWESWDRTGASGKAMYLNGGASILVSLQIAAPELVNKKLVMHALTIEPEKDNYWPDGSATKQMWKLGA